jgi:hypothetical protein
LLLAVSIRFAGRNSRSKRLAGESQRRSLEDFPADKGKPIERLGVYLVLPSNNGELPADFLRLGLHLRPRRIVRANKRYWRLDEIALAALHFLRPAHRRIVTATWSDG